MDSRRGGPGHVDDPGARLFLRRIGSEEERSRDDHAQLLHLVPGFGPVGCRRLQSRLRSGSWRRHRRAQLDWPERCWLDAQSGLRRDDTAAGICHLPDDVRGDHPRSDQRSLRRAQEVQGVRLLQLALGHLCVRPGRALGLGCRRLAAPAWRPRFRGRHRRSHYLGCRGAGRGKRPRPEDWQYARD